MNWPQHQFKFISKNGKKLARNKSKKINRKRLSGLSAGQIYYPRHRRCKKSITSSINRSNAPITSSCKINVHKRNPWKGMRIPSFFLPSFLRPSIPRPHPFSSSFFFFFRKTPLQQYPRSISLASSREREKERKRQMSHGSLLLNFFSNEDTEKVTATSTLFTAPPFLTPLFSRCFSTRHFLLSPRFPRPFSPTSRFLSQISVNRRITCRRELFDYARNHSRAFLPRMEKWMVVVLKFSTATRDRCCQLWKRFGGLPIILNFFFEWYCNEIRIELIYFIMFEK